MPEILLHHYPNSLFAEKIRLIFGFKKIDWGSVIIPAILPKPDVVALTGGYRRTPVLQIGANIYCDTALIAAVLERILPLPSLYPGRHAAASRTIAQWADSALFQAAVAVAFQPAGVARLFGGASADEIKAFTTDRAAMRGNLRRMQPHDAKAATRLYAQRLEALLLANGDWLCGDVPTIADFAAYHPLWFIKRAGQATPILDPFPELLRWMNRVDELGHGTHETIDSAAAVELARATPPRDLGIPWDEVDGLHRGARVTITPTDYALDPVDGELVVLRENEAAIRRVDERAGEVVVHFPRIGYEIRVIE